MSKTQQSINSDSVRNSMRGTEDNHLPFPRRTSISSQTGSDSHLPLTSGHPSSISTSETTLQSPSSEKSRMFKTMSRHNLAAFGAKLSSTAASVAVHTSKHRQNSGKDQLVDQLRDPGLIDVADSYHHHNDSGGINILGTSGNSTGGTLKSKMFKQSKTDLKNLRIKTDLLPRPSLNDLSPMVRGESTKELDRIAAIGQANSQGQTGDSPSGGLSGLSGHLHHHHHLHHPHISFRKRDSPASVLSSSASNSKLASEGTVYSFSQPSNNGQSSGTSMYSFKTVEEASSFMANSWTLLSQRIQPVFTKDEAMRIPVEDMNILVIMHFSAHHALGGSGQDLLNRVDNLITNGLRNSDFVPHFCSPERLAESWTIFYTKTLTSLEAIFLPLQLEFEARGSVFSSSQAAREYWYPNSGPRSSIANRFPGQNRKPVKLSIRRQILSAYRDAIVSPVLPMVLQKLESTSEPPVSNDVFMNLLRCFTALIQTDGDINFSIEKGLDTLKLRVFERHVKDIKTR